MSIKSNDHSAIKLSLDVTISITILYEKYNQ